ncbi:hypothetical protein Tco_0505907 [Tanacetum coccineum]
MCTEYERHWRKFSRFPKTLPSHPMTILTLLIKIKSHSLSIKTPVKIPRKVLHTLIIVITGVVIRLTISFVNDVLASLVGKVWKNYELLFKLGVKVFGKIRRKKKSEFAEDQAAKDRYWKILICYDDDEDEESSIPLKDVIISGLPPCIPLYHREKLLNNKSSYTNIEFLNENPTPDRVLKSPSSVPIFVTDSNSFFEKSDTYFSFSDNSLPEFETFSDHTEEARSGSTTTHAITLFLSIDSFLFEVEPDHGGLTSVVMDKISDNSTNGPLLELPEFESFHFDPSFPRPPSEPHRMLRFA